MPTTFTLDQLKAKFPTKTATPPTAPADGAKQTFTLDQLKQKYTGYKKPDTTQEPLWKRILGGAAKQLSPTGDVQTGIAKGVGSTLKGIGQLGSDTLDQTVGRGINILSGKGNTPTKPISPIYDQTSPESKKVDEALQPKGAVQSIAKGAEQVGEFFLPSGIEGDAVKAIDSLKGGELVAKLSSLGIPEHIATFLTNAGKMGLKMLTKGATGFGVTAAQEGTVNKDATASGVIGAALEPVAAGAKALKKTLPDVLNFTSGVKKGAIEEAMKSPDTIKQGLKMTMADIRDKAETSLNGLYKDMRTKFGTGLDALQKSTPYQAASKQFNNVRAFFGSTLADTKAGIPSIFRDFKVGVEDGGKKLNFDKLNSSIVKSAEQNNLQEALNTINRQKDFSPKGVQAVASRLEALTKYGDNNETSSIITKIKDKYDAAIEKHYPDLHTLRSDYGKTYQKLEDIKNIVGSSLKTPTQIQSAVNKLASIFGQDKETYMKIVQDLAKRSGINFPALIASDEFKKVLPDFIRGVGGGATLAVSSHFVNPFTMLLFPLFSPSLVGKAITNEGALPAVGKATSGVLKSLPSLLNQGGKKQ